MSISFGAGIGASLNVGGFSFGASLNFGFNLGFGSSYPTIDEVFSLPDTAHDWLWTACVALPNGTIIDRLRVLDIQFPFKSIDSTPRYRGGSYLHFPHHVNLDQCTIQFYETQDFFITYLINSWVNLICDDQGNYGLPVDFLGQIFLTMYDDNGDPRLTITLNGAWPNKIHDWTLGYTSSQHLQVSVPFSVNSVLFNNQANLTNSSPLGTAGSNTTPSTGNGGNSNTGGGSGSGGGNGNNDSGTNGGGNSNTSGSSGTPDVSTSDLGVGTSSNSNTGGSSGTPDVSTSDLGVGASNTGGNTNSDAGTGGGNATIALPPMTGFVDVPASGTPQPQSGSAGSVSIAPPSGSNSNK